MGVAGGKEMCAGCKIGEGDQEVSFGVTYSMVTIVSNTAVHI